MNTASPESRIDLVTRIAVILSLACFWLLPFSPFIELVAVVRTRRVTGWPRSVAIAGAVLCVVWTLLAATLLVWLALMLTLRRGFL